LITSSCCGDKLPNASRISVSSVIILALPSSISRA
jgi:hypothetical protein